MPTVTLFGPTDPVWAETFYEKERIVRVDVPCGPCQLKVCPIDHRCMKGITVERRASTITGDGDVSAVGDSSLWEDRRKVAVTRTGVEKKRLLARHLGNFNVDEVLDGVGKASCIVDPVG